MVMRQDDRSTFRMFCEMGCNILLVEYRGYGASSGTPSLVLDDVKDVCEHLVKHKSTKIEDMIVFGRSLGSVYCIHFAFLYPHIAGMILDSSTSIPADFVMKRRPKLNEGEMSRLVDEVRTHLDHKQKLSSYIHPLLVLHCKDDALFSPSQATDNFNAAGEKHWVSQQATPTITNTSVQTVTQLGNKSVVLFTKGGHNYMTTVNFEEYSEHIRSFMVTCGQKVPPKTENNNFCLIL